jgi:hypothetical protein
MSGKSIKRGLTGSRGEKSSLSEDIRFLLSFFILIAVFTCMAGGVDMEAHAWKQDMIIPDNLVDGGPEKGDMFGFSLASGDFNGDDSDDLAVGVPGESVGNVSSAGAVSVIYGRSYQRGEDRTRSGLKSEGAQLWHQGSGLGAGGGSEERDQFGFSLASGDFNGDKYDDLAVGVPRKKLGNKMNSGAMYVIYGSLRGLTNNSSQIWHEDMLIPGQSEERDSFGFSLASGDFTGDGYDDLAVGVPNEKVGGKNKAGATYIIRGSSLGLINNSFQLLYQNQTWYGDAEEGDNFGYSLASGNFDGDDFEDLAIGVPYEDVEEKDAGAVYVLFGCHEGLKKKHDGGWYQKRGGGKSEKEDLYGYSLASGDFNNDKYDDLAVGVPREDIEKGKNKNDAGAVNILYGSDHGFTEAKHIVLTQEDPFTSESYDVFGSSLASGDFNQDKFDDLAIGVPYENVVATKDAGAVNILYGSKDGFNKIKAKGLYQSYFGLASGPHNRFGTAVASGDFDKNGRYDLAVGVPQETLEEYIGKDSAGEVDVFMMYV